MAAVLAVDAGTTGVRCVAYDTSGSRVLASSYRELTQHFPRPGWVEHDAAEIWDLVRATVTEVASSLVAGRHAIAAIGVTNQRETVVAWNRRDGRLLARAVVWQDRRTAGHCDRLRDEGFEETVRSVTGLVLDPYFSASKMAWLLGEGGVAAGPDLALGTVDSWVCWNLTGGVAGGVHATDASNASRTMLFDIRERRWSPEMCATFGVPEESLAEVVASSGRIGVTAAGIAGDLPSGIPVSGVAGDQAAALFGQACFERGAAKATYGTGSFVLMNAGSTCPDPVPGVLTSVAWELAAGASPAGGETAYRLDGAGASPAGNETAYALEGAVFVTGAAIQWLRDGLGIIDEAAQIGPLAESVDSSEGVYVVPAFTGLGCPWWDPYARGIVTGITRGTGRAHIARAVVESIAFQVRDALEAMSGSSGRDPAILRVDGGAAVLGLLLRLQADQLQAPVRRAAADEVSALGAAWLAGMAEGVWTGTAELAEMWQGDSEVRPAVTAAAADASHAGWLEAVGRSRGWAATG